VTEAEPTASLQPLQPNVESCACLIFYPDKIGMFCTIIASVQRLPYITEGHCHEYHDYLTGRHRDPGHLGGCQDRTNQRVKLTTINPLPSGASAGVSARHVGAL
jgi:hypothetical protein